MARAAAFPPPFRPHPDHAPCSGTGTLAHNPEIKWRLQPGDLADLHARQAALLEQGRRALAPGGLLVYSTCSLEHEENEDVVASVPASWWSETMRGSPAANRRWILCGRDRGRQWVPE